MSLNRGDKTLTGDERFEVDEINIVGQGIGINSNFGTAGQLLKKNAIDNSIEWGSGLNATLTIQGAGANPNPTTFDGSADAVVNIASNTVAAPITLNAGEIGFDGTTGNLTINTNNNITADVITAVNKFLGKIDLTTDKKIEYDNQGQIEELFNAATMLLETKGSIIANEPSTSATLRKIVVMGPVAEKSAIVNVEINNLDMNNSGGTTPTITFFTNAGVPYVGLDMGTNSISNIQEAVANKLVITDTQTDGIVYGAAGATNVLFNPQTGDLETIGNITANQSNKVASFRKLVVSGPLAEKSEILHQEVNTVKFAVNGADQPDLTFAAGTGTGINMGGRDIIGCANMVCNFLNTSNGNITMGTGDLGCDEITAGDIACSGLDLGGGDIENVGDIENNSITAENDITSNTGNIIATQGNIQANYPGANSLFHQINTQSTSTLTANYSQIPTLFTQLITFKEIIPGNTPVLTWDPYSSTGQQRIHLQGGSISNGEDIGVKRIKTWTSLLEVCDSKNHTVRFRNRNIQFGQIDDDNNYTAKYTDRFVINTQDITAGTGGFEYYDNSMSWFVADFNEMGTGPFVPAYTGVGTTPGVRQSGTGTGSTGGFATYPHIDFRGAGVGGQRIAYSKRFPKLGLSDIEKIQVRVIQGSSSNGGENCDSGDNLFICWSDANGAFASLPTSATAATGDFHLQLVAGSSTLYHSWTLLSYVLSTDFTETQKTNFQQARRIAFVATHTGSAVSDFDHYGITDIQFFTINEQTADDSNLTRFVEGPGVIGKTSNSNYTKANGVSFSTLSGGWAYLGLNYTNGWYYEQLDLTKFIPDDDNSNPSGMMIMEPTTSLTGSVDNTGGLVLTGSNHTQLYYTFRCPPGYAIVGYYISLNDANGVRINPQTHNTGFYNHLIQAHSGYVGDGADITKTISQPTDGNGNPDLGGTNSINGFNKEVPVSHLAGSYPVFSNTFTGSFGTEQYGSFSDLRNWKQYYIMCYRSATWTDAFRFKGGYIKYRRLDPGES